MTTSLFGPKNHSSTRAVYASDDHLSQTSSLSRRPSVSVDDSSHSLQSAVESISSGNDNSNTPGNSLTLKEKSERRVTFGPVMQQTFVALSPLHSELGDTSMYRFNQGGSTGHSDNNETDEDENENENDADEEKHSEELPSTMISAPSSFATVSASHAADREIRSHGSSLYQPGELELTASATVVNLSAAGVKRSVSHSLYPSSTSALSTENALLAARAPITRASTDPTLAADAQRPRFRLHPLLSQIGPASPPPADRK